MVLSFYYSRSALHPEGAHGLEAELHHVAALGGELMATALEALLVEDNDLGRETQTAMYEALGSHSCSEENVNVMPFAVRLKP